jgi:hypothetical protein
MILFQRRCKPRWLAAILLTAAAGGVTLLGYYALLPSHDAQVVFTAPTLDVQTGDPHQASHLYYIEWLSGNLSRGFFMLAVLGFALMLTRENHRGLYAALAFWVPIIALSLLAYRKHRFMFFAFPLYTAAFSYGLVLLARLVMQARKSTAHALLAGLILLFGLRLAVSAASLAHTSVAYARGADETLATRHPKFRTPCLYVRQHLQPDTVVLADTVVTALYYIGRVDNWYPAVPPWESWETGMVGLKDLDELQAYVAAYPKGFFIAEWYRFDYAPELSPARDWVKTHMKRIDQACTGDVTLYAWGVP